MTPSAKQKHQGGSTARLLTAPMLRGEVWWVGFDPAAGSKIRKTWPAIIVSNNAANRNLSRNIVVPLTSNTHRLCQGEALMSVAGKQNKAMAGQPMTADKIRLKSKIDALSKADLLAVELALRVQLESPI